MTAHEAHVWVRRVTDGAPDAEVARRIAVNQTTYSKQRRSSKYTPDTIVRISRAYGANPLEGLVAHGLLTREDIRTVRDVIDVRTASDDELLAEVERRIKSRSASATMASGDPIPVTILSDDVPPGWEELPNAADAERRGDDPDEDND